MASGSSKVGDESIGQASASSPTTPSETLRGSVYSGPPLPLSSPLSAKSEPHSPCALCGGEVAPMRRRRTLAVTGERKRRRSERNNLSDDPVSNGCITPGAVRTAAGCPTSSDGETREQREELAPGARCPTCDRVYHVECGDLRPNGLETREALGIRGVSYSCGRCRKRRQEAYRLATTGNKSVPVGPDYQAPNIPKLWCQPTGGWKRGHPAARPKCVWNPKLAEANGLTTDDIDEFLEAAESDWPAQAIVHTEGSAGPPRLMDDINGGSRRSSRLRSPRGEVSVEYRAPFSADMALGVLHLAKYDCDKALQLLSCPEFYTPSEGGDDERPPRQSIMAAKLSLPTKPYVEKDAY